MTNWRRCPKCNNTVFDSMRCPRCQSETEEIPRCKNCKNVIWTNNNECSYCGQDTNKTVSTPSPSPISLGSRIKSLINNIVH